jgi:DNA-directed RNA polymerase subunit RPC12/RpoP
MANFRFNCPSCGMQLELDERHAGQEVECGHCYQIFIAPRVKPRPDRSPTDEGWSSTSSRRPRIPHEFWDDERPRHRRRDGSDNDDFAPSASHNSSESDSLAILSLILGVISFPIACCCWPVGLATSSAAITTGIFGLRSSANHLMAILGLIFGVLSFGLAVLGMFIGFGNLLINR